MVEVGNLQWKWKVGGGRHSLRVLYVGIWEYPESVTVPVTTADMNFLTVYFLFGTILGV